ncbi:MAG: hypothetical protein KC582_00990 [Candidatus Magasanikbacteria bacterium]|nr:hypothetical protein [Candidatus Magasanikbacteria bacterium]
MTNEKNKGANEAAVENSPNAIIVGIHELGEKRLITPDQASVSEKAVRNKDYALVANRALTQGTDPELLNRTVPESVNKVADKLGLTPEQATEAIALAHQRGPGALSVDSSEEWLWLVLAKHSADESKANNDPAKTLADTARKIVAFEQYANQATDPMGDAKAFRGEMLEKVQPTGMAPLGANVPLYESDLGFYAAYRTGHAIAAVKSTDGLVFYGTDGSIDLEKAGIKVDKVLSPTFGIVFPE